MVRLRIHEFVERSGLSLDAFCDRARLPRRVVVALIQERPPTTVRLAVLERVAAHLSVDVGDLFESGDTGLWTEAGVSVSGVGDDDLADLDAEWEREHSARATSAGAKAP